MPSAGAILPGQDANAPLAKPAKAGLVRGQSSWTDEEAASSFSRTCFHFFAARCLMMCFFLCSRKLKGVAAVSGATVQGGGGGRRGGAGMGPGWEQGGEGGKVLPPSLKIRIGGALGGVVLAKALAPERQEAALAVARGRDVGASPGALCVAAAAENVVASVLCVSVLPQHRNDCRSLSEALQRGSRQTNETKSRGGKTCYVEGLA